MNSMNGRLHTHKISRTGALPPDAVYIHTQIKTSLSHWFHNMVLVMKSIRVEIACQSSFLSRSTNDLNFRVFFFLDWLL